MVRLDHEFPLQELDCVIADQVSKKWMKERWGGQQQRG